MSGATKRGSVGIRLLHHKKIHSPFEEKKTTRLGARKAGLQNKSLPSWDPQKNAASNWRHNPCCLGAQKAGRNQPLLPEGVGGFKQWAGRALNCKNITFALLALLFFFALLCKGVCEMVCARRWVDTDITTDCKTTRVQHSSPAQLLQCADILSRHQLHSYDLWISIAIICYQSCDLTICHAQTTHPNIPPSRLL